MDFFDVTDPVKTEKACAMLRFNRLKALTKMFRFLEFCLGLVLFSWISTRLPFAVKISGDFFRRFGEVIASPVAIFVICNLIIVTLFVKSENLGTDNADDELYEEFITNNSENRSMSENPATPPAQLSEKTLEVTYQDKQIIVSETNGTTPTTKLTCTKDSDSDVHPQKVCYREAKKSEEGMEEMAGSMEEDELSDEEFQRAVDEFIAKQLMFRRQESLDVVLRKGSPLAEFEQL